MSFTDKRVRYAAAALIAIAFCAGVLYSERLGSSLRYPDEEWYVVVADNLASKHMYSYDGETPTAFRPPGYPLLLAAINKVGGAIPAYRVVNMLAFAGCLILVFHITTRESGPRAGLIAVLMTLCYPVLFYTAGTVYPQTVASLILLAIVWLILRPDSLPWKSVVILGVLTATLTLTVPTMLWVLPFLAFWMIVQFKEHVVGKVVGLLVVVCITMYPWVARNYVSFHAFVPLSTNGGFCLLLGNSENTLPNAGPNVDLSDHRPDSELNEAEADRYQMHDALRFMRTHPSRAAKLYLMKFLNHFNYRNDLATRSEASRTRDMIMLFTYGPLLALALVRLLRVHRIPLTRCELFVYTFYMSYGAWCAILFTRIRYRLPADFLLILVCALFVSRLVSARPIGPSPKTQL